jgi:hypothetical protein
MIPIPAVSPKLIAAIVIGGTLVAAGWLARGQIARGQIAELRAEQATQIAAAQTAHRQAIEAARARETAITAKAEEIVNAARQANADLHAARVAADNAAAGLRDAAARYAARRCQPAAAPLGSPPGTMPAGLHDADQLLRVLGELDHRAGNLAEAADRARAAGAACERIYDAARAELMRR